MRRTKLVYLAAVCVLFFGSARSQQATRKSVDALIYELKHPEPDQRRQAAQLLGQNKVRQAVPALIEATNDTNDAVRREVVTALVRINDTRALQAYIGLTRDPMRAVQEKSIEGIINTYVTDDGGFIRGAQKFADFINPWSDDYNPLAVEPYVPVSENAINALAELLQSRDATIRKDAAVALGILRAASALPAIQDSLAREERDEVKVELIRAIYKIGDPRAAEVVVPFVRDPAKKVHDEAIMTAGRLRVKKAVPDMRDLYESGIKESRKILGLVPITGKDDLARKLFEAMSYVGDPSCAEIMLAGFQDERVFYRRYGAEGLGRIGDLSQVTMIATAYIKEKVPEAKLAMSYALYRLGRDEHLLELALGGDQGSDYLLELAGSEIPKLYPHLRSEKDPIKVRLLNVIGLRGDGSSLKIVEEFMNSGSADVASAANIAVRRLRARFPS
jgi:HEAT repeat protein